MGLRDGVLRCKTGPRQTRNAVCRAIMSRHVERLDFTAAPGNVPVKRFD